MIKEIVKRIGAPQYIVSHGFGYVLNDVTISAEPIRLNISLSGSGSSSTPITVYAEPITLVVNLRGSFIVGPRIFYAEPIRLNIRLTGGAFSREVIYLDWDAQISTGINVIRCVNINTHLEHKVNVEEEISYVRIT